MGDFHGGPVAKTSTAGALVPSLIWKLRSCMLCGVAKKKKKKQTLLCGSIYIKFKNIYIKCWQTSMVLEVRTVVTLQEKGRGPRRISEMQGDF